MCHRLHLPQAFIIIHTPHHLVDTLTQILLMQMTIAALMYYYHAKNTPSRPITGRAWWQTVVKLALSPLLQQCVVVVTPSSPLVPFTGLQPCRRPRQNNGAAWVTSSTWIRTILVKRWQQKRGGLTPNPGTLAEGEASSGATTTTSSKAVDASPPPPQTAAAGPSKPATHPPAAPQGQPATHYTNSSRAGQGRRRQLPTSSSSSRRAGPASHPPRHEVNTSLLVHNSTPHRPSLNT